MKQTFHMIHLQKIKLLLKPVAWYQILINKMLSLVAHKFKPLYQL